MENQDITEIKKCPNCKCTETAARKAVELAERELPSGSYVSAEKLVVPLQEPSTVAVSMKVLIIHTDYCLKCGTRYMTKAEVKNAPVSFNQPGQPGIPPFMRRG